MYMEYVTVFIFVMNGNVDLFFFIFYKIKSKVEVVYNLHLYSSTKFWYRNCNFISTYEFIQNLLTNKNRKVIFLILYIFDEFIISLLYIMYII